MFGKKTDNLRCADYLFFKTDVVLSFMFLFVTRTDCPPDIFVRASGKRIFPEGK